MALEHELSIEYAPFVRKLNTPFKIANDTIYERTGYYFRVSKKINGKTYTGYGEAAPLSGFSIETMEELADTIKYSSFMEILAQFAKAAPHFPASIRMALDSAFVEISLACGESILEYTNPVKVNAVLPIHATIREANALWEKGFRTFKLKVSPETSNQVIATIESLIKEFPSEIKLRIDSNQSFSVVEALNFCENINGLNLEYWEDPVSINNVADFLEVKNNSTTPLAIDQGFTSLKNLHRFLDLNLADIFIIKPTVIGGITNSLYAVRFLEEAKKDFVITTAFETEVGRRAIQILSLQYPGKKYAYGLATGDFFSENLLPDIPVLSNVLERSPSELDILEQFQWKKIL